MRNVAPSDAIRVLATNLGADEADAAAFGELYHQRWRSEEAFKRLKHLLHLEAVSGLSQQAQIVDVAAKVLADNLGALMAIVASDATGLPQRQRRCNRSYAARLIQRVLPGVLLLVGDVIDTIIRAIDQLAANTQRYHPGRSRPRPPHQLKPHPRLAYKG